MKEVWADITGYEGFYQVSNLGRVKHLANGIKCNRERFLVGINQGCGYLAVGLSKGGVKKMFLIHRLVAAAFFGDHPGLSVNHKNGNKHNNRIDNLEYMTLAENNRHARKNGLAGNAIGERVGTAKLTGVKAAEIKRKLKATGGANIGSIAKEYGVTYGTIHAIFKNRTWRHVQ